jgi:hypothetical protein
MYPWSPLALVEFASEGHNDALMVFFTIAALAATTAPATLVFGSVPGRIIGAADRKLPNEEPLERPRGTEMYR